MMDIVTNIHSKRKTETMISFYQGIASGLSMARVQVFLCLIHPLEVSESRLRTLPKLPTSRALVA